MSALAIPVWVKPLPWAIDEMAAQQDALKLLFGDDLTIRQHSNCAVIYTPGEECDCGTCTKHLRQLIAHATGKPEAFENGIYFCPDCKLADCGKSYDHRSLCDKDSFIQNLKKEAMP